MLERPRPAPWILAFALPLGCGDDGNDGASGTGAGTGDTTSNATQTSGPATATAVASGDTTASVDASSSDGGTSSGIGDTTDGSGGTTGDPSVCGDGMVEGREVCDGAPGCLDDCTYPHGTVFWEAEIEGVMPGDDARVWAVGFDADDRPVYGGDQYGSGGGAFAAVRETTGDLLWSQRSSMTSTHFAYGLAVTAERIVLAGQNVAGPGYGNDVLARAFTLGGVVDWSWTVNDPANEWFVAAAADADGGVVLAGGRNGDPEADDRALLTRLGPLGSELWTVDDVGMAGAENGFVDVVVADAGTTIALGCCDAVAGNAVLAAYDGDGAPLWRTTLDVAGAGVFFGGGLTRAGDGRLVAATTDDDGAPWLVIADAEGNVLASQAIAGAEGVYPTGIAATPQGTFVMAGELSDGSGGTQIWYGVLADDGVLLSSTTIVAPAGNFGRADSVAVDSHGLALLGGERCITAGSPCELRGYLRMFAP